MITLGLLVSGLLFLVGLAYLIGYVTASGYHRGKVTAIRKFVKDAKHGEEEEIKKVPS